MRKLSKFLVYSIAASGLICGCVGNTFAYSSIVSESDRALARVVQGQELRKINSDNKLQTIKSEIRKNEEKINKRENEVRSKLDEDLATVLQIEESLKSKLENSSWAEKGYIRKKIKENDYKKSQVDKKIKKNEREIEELKHKRNKLDSDYAVLLQCKELY